jgi:transposase-like protein
VSDDHAGLKKAIREVFPEAGWQRCYVHYADLRIMPPATWNSAPAAMIAATGSA